MMSDHLQRWSGSRQFGLVLTLGCASCAMFATPSGLRIEQAERDKLRKELLGNTYYLAASMYTADFFGTTDRLWAEPRRSDMVRLQNAAGKKLEVPQLGEPILWAGMPVEVTAVRYPEELAAAGPTKPTAHTWIEVKRTEEKGPLLVFVLPVRIGSASAFRTRVRGLLASKQWVSSWLEQRGPAVLDNIYEKKIVEGMSQAELAATLGEATNASSLGRGQLDEVAEYGDLLVTLTGGVVTKVISQAAVAEAARVKAEKERKKREAIEAARRAAAEKKRKAEEAKRLAAEKKRKAAQEVRRKQEEKERRIAEEKAAQEQRIAEEKREKERHDAAEAARKKREAEQKAIEAARKKDDAKQQKEEAKRLRVEAARNKKEAAAAAKAEAARKKQEVARSKREAAMSAKEQRQAEAARKKEDRARATADAAKQRAAMGEAKRLAARTAAERQGFTAEVEAAQAQVNEVEESFMEPAAKAQRAVEAASARQRKATAAGAAKVATAERRLAVAKTPRKTHARTQGRKLGLEVGSVTDALVRELFLDDNVGVHVAAVTPGGPGDAAGFRPGDIIKGFDGKTVTDPQGLVRAAAAASTTQNVEVEVFRDGGPMVLNMEPVADGADPGAIAAAAAALASAQADLDAARERGGGEVADAEAKLAAVYGRMEKKVAPMRARLAEARAQLAAYEGKPAAAEGRWRLGLKIKPVPAADLQALRLSGGAVVADVSSGGAGASAGLRRNDIIVRFDGTTVGDPRALAGLAAKAAKDRKIDIEVVRRGKLMTLHLFPKGGTTAASPPAPAPRATGRKRPDNRRLIPNRRPVEVTGTPQ